LIIGSAILLNPEHAYPGFWALAPSLGAALVIVAGHTVSSGHDGPLAHPMLVWLGDRSYSLYLWHWPVFILSFTLGLQGQVLPILGMILVSLLLAILSFRYIELPFWKGRWSHFEPRRVILVSFLIMVTMILAMYHGIRELPKSDSTTDVSNQWRRDKPVIYRYSCDTWYESTQIARCVFGKETASKTVVFLGDSIGLQWFSIAPIIFPQPLWRIIVLTKSSCALVDEDYYYSHIGKTYQVCTDWRNKILDEMDKLRPDILIMGNSATYDFSESQWIDGSSRILDRLSVAARKVFVIPGTPNLGFDGPGCTSRHLSVKGQIDKGACLAKDRISLIKPGIGFLEQAVNRFANVHMLNLNNLVCPGGNCRAVSTEGLVVFRDSRHLTDTFVRAQVPYIRERMEQLSKDSELLNKGGITW